MNSILTFSDGQIQITIWFKSWLNHIGWFDMTKKKILFGSRWFDLDLIWDHHDLICDLVKSQLSVTWTGQSWTQSSTSFADMVDIDDICKPKQSRTKQKLSTFCVTVFAKFGATRFNPAELSEFQIFTENAVWFNLRFGLTWFVISVCDLRFDLSFGTENRLPGSDLPITDNLLARGTQRRRGRSW